MKLKRWKLVLDVALAVTLVLLYDVHTVTGLSFHEWAGIAIGVAFIVHIALNWKWVVQTTRTLFGRHGARAKMLFVVDVLALIAMAWAIVSGIFISRIAVPQFASMAPIWKATHVPSSYVALLLVAVHLGLHWGWVMTMVRRWLGRPQLGAVGAWVARGLAVLLFAGGVFAAVSTDALGHAARIIPAVATQQEAGHEHAPSEEAGHAPSGEPVPGKGGGKGLGKGRVTEEGGVPTGGGRGGGHGATGTSEATASALVKFGGVLAAGAVPAYYLDAAVVAWRRKRRGGSVGELG